MPEKRVPLLLRILGSLLGALIGAWLGAEMVETKAPEQAPEQHLSHPAQQHISIESPERPFQIEHKREYDPDKEPLKPGWSRPEPKTLPKPTFNPALLAFGTMLIALGIPTNWIISAIGAIIFFLAIGRWIGELSHEQRA